MQLYDYAPEITDNNVEITDTPNLLKSEFGDGYASVAPNGINHIEMRASVIWKTLTRSQRDTLVSFFRERGGYKNFEWQPPSESESYYWKCEDWKSSAAVAPNHYNVTANIYQVFDLGPDF